ncbi:MAG: hypothetical protein ACSNEK_09445 [Parachlamydiaceae bacterium]
MLAITRNNPFKKIICQVLTTPKPLLLSSGIRQLESIASYGSLTFSSLASIIHIATVIFSIVAVATGPMFIAVVLAGTALAGTGVLLAITAVALRQTSLYKGKISLNGRNFPGMPRLNSLSSQHPSVVPSIKLSSATIPLNHETKRKKSPRLEQLNQSSVNQLFSELEAKDRKNAKLKKENTSLQQEMQIVKNERKKAQDECTRLENQITSLNTHIDVLRKLNLDVGLEKGKLKDRVKKLEQELANREMDADWTKVMDSADMTDKSPPNSGKEAKS